MKIYIDADACPVAVKEIIYKTSNRLQINVILAANQTMKIPQSDYIRMITVPDGPDEADDAIVQMMQEGDLVISADIPLAARCIEKGGYVLDPRGTLLTKDNIGGKLAVRNLMSDLRSTGMETGGPNAFSKKDRQNFANQLDKLLTSLLNG